MSAPLKARMAVALQWLLPTRLLSSLVHWLAQIRTPWVKNTLIRAFLHRFPVDLSEAAEPDIRAYPHFNAFFTRALRDGARPLPAAPGRLASPVDGSLSQWGKLDDGRLLQAKGAFYDAGSLLGEDAAVFHGGSFCTIYLAPHNYHRIHAPTDLRLRGWRHLPGRLFSVNPTTVAARPRLFSRNERVVCFFETADGPLAMVMVGALLVGSVELVWAGCVCPPHRRGPSPRQSADGRFRQGEELGRFNMGSTVILVAAPGVMQLSHDLREGQPVRLGQDLGRCGSELAARTGVQGTV